MCDQCGIDNLFAHYPINLGMPIAIDHLFAHCPNKSPKAMITVPVNMISQLVTSETPKGYANLNAITRLQTSTTPIIEMTNADDKDSTKTNKNKPKKRNNEKKETETKRTKEN